MNNTPRRDDTPTGIDDVDTPAPDCLMCAQAHQSRAARVFADDRWAAEVFEGYEVPGWLILRLRRHAIGITSLTPQELAEFGVRMQDLSGAVQEVTGAVRTYLMVFGESNPHFHALIVPRLATTPPARRAGDILKNRLDLADRGASLAMVPLLREEYRTRATTKAVPAAGDRP